MPVMFVMSRSPTHIIVGALFLHPKLCSFAQPQTLDPYLFFGALLPVLGAVLWGGERNYLHQLCTPSISHLGMAWPGPCSVAPPPGPEA